MKLAETTVAQLERLADSNPTPANRLNLSQALLREGLNGRAIQILNGLVSADPRNALAWNNLGFAHTLQRKYKPAVAACQEGMRLDPGNTLLRNNLRWSQGERDTPEWRTTWGSPS